MLVAGCGSGSNAPDAADPDGAVNNNATLAALTASVGALDPPFQPDITTYDLRLPLAEDAVSLTPTAAVPAGTMITVGGAAVASGAPSNPLSLLPGGQDVYIIATAEGGASATYLVHAYRGTPNLELSYAGGPLTNPLVPAFDPTTLTYTVDVGLWVQWLQLTVTPVVAGSTVTVRGGAVAPGTPSMRVPLNLGATTIPVVVTPPTGTPQTYMINVTRGTQALQRAYAKASNTGAADNFGAAVAIWGDTLVVGSWLEDSTAVGVDGNQADDSSINSGAVYVFTRTGTSWSQEAYLKASNTGASEKFGYYVAVSADTVAVSAVEENSSATGIDGNQADSSFYQAGAVYVFTRTGTTWSQQAYIKASNTGIQDWFGNSIALWGDTLAVGAPFEDSAAIGIDGNQADDSAVDSGAVYVFTRTGTTWSQQAYLKSSNSEAGDYFGNSVALWGDTLAVGAQLEDSSAVGVDGNQADNGASSSGAVYVFTRSGTTWSQEAYLKASNTGANDYFGFSVALSGDTLAASAWWEDSNATSVGGNQADNSAADSGAVYVFTRTGTTWSQEAYVKPSNTGASDYFGYAVALWGDTLAVGAVQEDSAATGIGGNQADNTSSQSGAVYVFMRSMFTGWTQSDYVKASNTGAQDWFGHSVALWGDTLAVGAHWEDSAAVGIDGNQADNSAVDSGAVYIFR